MFGSSANVLHVIPSLTRNPVLIPLWIPDQSHLAGSVTSGMTYVRFFRQCLARHSGPDPESSFICIWIPDQSHLAGSVTSGMTYVRLFRQCLARHSGLDPESSFIYSWNPDKSHFAGSVASGMTWPWRLASNEARASTSARNDYSNASFCPCSLHSLYARLQGKWRYSDRLDIGSGARLYQSGLKRAE